MKVSVTADSQEEFDQKRPAVIKALAGNKFDVVLKAKMPSVYDLEKPAIAERKGYMRAQNEMIDHFGRKLKATLNQIKKDINSIVR